nr:phospholipase A2 inhibitor and Ly6/PLAUR domain-containing protein-like isoform X2 [Pogona vitticeps]
MHPLTLYWFKMGILLFLAGEGLPLRCEICRDTNYDCTGPAYACLPFFDSCVTIQSEKRPAFSINKPYHSKGKRAVLKKCIGSSICSEGVSIVNIGRRGIITTKVSCCKGDDCRKPALPLPPINTTANGKACPVCLTFSKTICQSEGTVRCVGDQLYCLLIYGIASAGVSGTFASIGDPVISSHIAIRGCANQVFCDTFHEGAVHLASLTLIGSGNCELATSTVQGLSVYFLPVLGGLFLLKSIA